ncbi:MAG TPA: endonuclease V [Thermotoga sp.]|nr:endonuclease V [Thermotoga sp.]
MKYKNLHRWDLQPEEAMELQRRLKKEVVLKPFNGELRYVAGADLSFPGENVGLAVVVVLEFPSLRIKELVHEKGSINFPYIPGLLAFREGPLFLKAWEKVKTKPDVVFFDGQGIAHPRGLGIASHMGLFLEIPTVGVAKSRLYGKYEKLPPEQGSFSYLLDDGGRTIGIVFRSRANVSPIFISPGHLVDVESSFELVKKVLIPGKRIPEPTRMAHLYTQRLKSSLF